MKKIVFIFTLMVLLSSALIAQDSVFDSNFLRFKVGMEYRNNTLNSNYSANPILTFGLDAKVIYKIHKGKYSDMLGVHGIVGGVDYGIGKSNLECDVYSFSGYLGGFIEGVGNAEKIPCLQFMLGAKYQYDNILTQNESFNSHSVGPMFRFSYYQWNFETGYLWGVNKIVDNDKMNTFFLKLSVSIPTFGFSYRANMNKTFNAATL
jgi:hypothetical protein